jgi:hypothetical protein
MPLLGGAEGMKRKHVAGRNLEKIDIYFRALDYLLFSEKIVKPSVGTKAIGIAKYYENYGWPVVFKLFHKGYSDKQEHLYIKTMPRAEPIDIKKGEFNRHYYYRCSESAKKLDRYRTELPYLSFVNFYDKTIPNMIYERALYKKNYEKIIEIYNKMEKLNSGKKLLLKAFQELRAFDRERRLLCKKTKHKKSKRPRRVLEKQCAMNLMH